MSGTYPADPIASRVQISSLKFNLMSESLSGRRQVRGIGSQRWALTASYNPMTRAEFMPVYAFIVAQNGQFETFTFSPPVVGSTSGTATGTVTTNTSVSIGATTISLTGLTGVLKAGDYIKFANHSKVYMLMADRSGAGTVAIQPPLVAAVASGQGVTYNDVPFTVRLDNDLQQYSLNGFERFIYEVDMVEAL
jgi:hypothetical protein